MFGRFVHARCFKLSVFNHGPNFNTGGGGGAGGNHGAHAGPGPPPGQSCRPPWSSTNLRDHEPPRKSKGDGDEEDQLPLIPEEMRIQCSVQRWAYSPGQLRFWRAEPPVSWGDNDFLVSKLYASKKCEEIKPRSCLQLLERRIDFFLGDLIKQQCQLGALPVEHNSDHDALSTLSGYKALTVDELRKLVDVEKTSEEPQGTPSVPVIRITKCRDSEEAVFLPKASSGPSRSSSTSSVTSIDTNSASFVESELRHTHDLILAHIDAELGLDMVLSGDTQSGIELLRSAARTGSAEAAHNLGVAYQQMGDLERALASYRRAASQDYVPSLKNLAVFYKRGLGGVERDEALAREISNRAKRLQVTEEQEERTGHCKSCEENGWSDKGNPSREVIAKSPESMYLLARAYHLGLSGCPADLQYAKALYKSAADAGNISARNALRSLEGEQKECSRLNDEDEEDADIISPLATFDSSRTYLRKTSMDSGFEIAGETVTT